MIKLVRAAALPQDGRAFGDGCNGTPAAVACRILTLSVSGYSACRDPTPRRA